MCGIYAVIGNQSVTESLLSGLSQLSYRGYDSAGIAVADNAGIQRQRAEGKLANLAELVNRFPLEGRVGIAHTRWATHGLPNETNAHPHMTDEVALVHNGIVENYAALKSQLESEGYAFQSETDSETIAQLLTYHLRNTSDSMQSLYSTLQQIEGSYAIATIFSGKPDQLIVARKGSPLVIGKAENGFYVSSDENALANQVKEVMYLQDGEVAILSADTIELFNSARISIDTRFTPFDHTTRGASKGDHAHYMMKEIEEQPDVFDRCWHNYFDATSKSIDLPSLATSLDQFSRVSIVACGTSYYSGMVARYWLEQFAGVPVDLDIASEYRYRGAPADPNSAVLFISQSGETADTLAAMRYAKARGQTCFTMVNVINSSMAREADVVLPTFAGPEIGVASTKAFVSQLTALMMLTFAFAKAKGKLEKNQEVELFKNLKQFSHTLEEIISRKKEIEKLAEKFDDAQSAIFLGRGYASALAFEGALKLKEISYIHAEAYPAGELKHGPLALVDESMPIVMLAPPNELFGKSLSNLREVASRGGKIILMSDQAGIDAADDFIVGAFAIPDSEPMLQALLYAVPLQLLAYYCALRRGNDVDQPRNLAKSVTVE